MKQQNRIAIAGFFMLVVFICGSCTQRTTNTNLTEARQAITNANASYFQLYAKNDGSILNLYTDDACLLPPNAPAICGRSALAKDFKDTYSSGIVKSGQFTTQNIYGDGIEYVTEEGVWQVFDKEGISIDDGKFLKLWKKAKDGWKIFRDSFNSNHSRQ
jgi:ketosteroid isomerase-like protein